MNTHFKLLKKFLISTFIFAFFILISPLLLPVTGTSLSSTIDFSGDNTLILNRATGPETNNDIPDFSTFINQVTTNQKTSSLVGVYVPGKFALPVIQQPSGNAAYVSTQNDLVTQFGLATKYQSTGLLAHNYLSGQYFFNLVQNDYAALVFGNGEIQYFQIESVYQYQALSPNSPYSNFKNVFDANDVISSTTLFHRVYTDGSLVFQTCIAKGSEMSWGRLFVVARPVDSDKIPSFEMASGFENNTLSETNSLLANTIQ
jgi:hypothetical protein